MLGGALVGLKQNAQAEPFLIEGYEGLLKNSENIPLHLRLQYLSEALDRLIQHYIEIGKSEEAKKWRVEKEKLKAGNP
jgi:hypothetical protein